MRQTRGKNRGKNDPRRSKKLSFWVYNGAFRENQSPDFGPNGDINSCHATEYRAPDSRGGDAAIGRSLANANSKLFFFRENEKFPCVSRDGDVITRRLWAHQNRHKKLSRWGDLSFVIAAVFVAKIGRQS
jgi:hypothetical protein